MRSICYKYAIMDYSVLIQAAIDFIEENLFEDIRSSDVATHIGFSEYHLHRIFCGMLAESVSEYIRKRRIFEIARLLKTTDRPIQDLAGLVRFDSPEAFSRAFKKIYGVKPSQYRRSHKGWDFQKTKITPKMLDHLRSGITLEPSFENYQAEHVIGLAASFMDERSQGVNNLWQELIKRKDEIKNVKEDTALGVFLADHPNVKRGPQDTYIYLAGLPVNQIEDIPAGMVTCTIPQAKYAIFTHCGSIDTVLYSIDYIWGTWIPNNIENYQHANAPDFELFDSRFDLVKQEGQFDHYVPVETTQ
jgi:AraC family transcriptional regulator